MTAPLLLRGYGFRHPGTQEVSRCRQRGCVPPIPLPAEPGTFVGVSLGREGTWIGLPMPSVGLVFTSVVDPVNEPGAPDQRGKCHHSDSSPVNLIRSKVFARITIRMATPRSERREAPGTWRLAGVGGKPSADTESLLSCGGARRTGSCWVGGLARRGSRPKPKATPAVPGGPAVRFSRRRFPEGRHRLKTNVKV